jgi:ferrous iron transport protein A
MMASARHSASLAVPAGAVLSLSAIKAGKTVVVRRINGGRSITQRLASMGLLAGSRLTVLRNSGPVIVRIGDNRLVLGRGAAQHLDVEADGDAAQ